MLQQPSVPYSIKREGIAHIMVQYSTVQISGYLSVNDKWMVPTIREYYSDTNYSGTALVTKLTKNNLCLVNNDYFTSIITLLTIKIISMLQMLSQPSQAQAKTS